MNKAKVIVVAAAAMFAVLPAFAFEFEPGAVVVQPGQASKSQWLWDSKSEATNGCVAYFRKTFRVESRPRRAVIDVFFDDGGGLYVNGVKKPVGDITDALKGGENTLAFRLTNDGGSSAISFLVSGEDAEGKPFYVHSDAGVKVSREAVSGWEMPGFDDSRWNAVTTLGDVLANPWARYFDIRSRMTTPDERKRLMAAEAEARALPSGIESEPAMDARVVYDGPSPKIVVNGKKMAPCWNMCGTGDPYRDTAAIRAGRAGFKFQHIWINADHVCPKEGLPYDFSRLDSDVRRALHLQNDVYVIVAIRLTLAKWIADFPDDMQEYGTGPIDPKRADDRLGRPQRPSCVSRRYRAKALDIIRAAGEYVASQPWANRVAGVRVAYGVYTEWHSYGMYEAPDTGKAMTAHFREWLRSKYLSDAALAAAWGEKGVTLDTANVPAVAERTVGGTFLDPVKNRKALDYFDCHANAMADLLLSFAHVARQAFPGRIIGAYYGYVFSLHPPEGSNILLDKVLSSPDIDFLSNPPSYTGYSRLNGGSYAPRTVTSTFRRYGKLSLLEDDSRFHHIYDWCAEGKSYCTRTPRETRMAMRRNWLNGFFNGCGIQMCDPMKGVGQRPNAFDDPAVWEAIAESQAALGKAGAPSADSGNDVAVVVNPRERLRCDGARKVSKATYGIYQTSILHLHRSGIAFDLMSLEDYLAEKRDFRTVLFLNAFYLDNAERAALKAKVAKPGVSAVWLVAPGSVTDGGFSDPAMSDLVGMKLAGAGTDPKVSCLDRDAVRICGGRAFMKDTANGGKSIFLPAPPDSGEGYADVLVAAGAHAYVKPGSYFRRHGDVFMFNTGEKGRHVITLPERDRRAFAVELFSGVRMSAADIAVGSDGADTWFFKLER